MPSAAGSSTIPRSRSRSSSPFPFVVKLNSRLPETDATVTTAKICASVRFDTITRVGARRAGAIDSTGAIRANSTPHASAATAGTTNAACQPAYLSNVPVTTADNATPILPAKPLKPIVKPGRGERCTSIGMPTG